MQLRDYPIMQRKWPPIWHGRYEHDVTLKGEIGVLTRVGADCSGNRAQCHLYITYRRKLYVGTLLFDDQDECDVIAAFLKKHYGERIKDIARLDISASL